MTYYLVRTDTKAIIDESIEEPEELDVLKLKIRLDTDIMVIEGKEVYNTQNLEVDPGEDSEGESESTAPETIDVKVTNRVALAIVVGHDKACQGQDPPGKPTLEPPSPGNPRVVKNSGDIVKVLAQAAYSCKDDSDTPVIKAAGNKEYYQVADGDPEVGLYLRGDRVEIV